MTGANNFERAGGDFLSNPITEALGHSVTDTIAGGVFVGLGQTFTVDGHGIAIGNNKTFNYTSTAGTGTSLLICDTIELNLSGDFDGDGALPDNLIGSGFSFNFGTATTTGTTKPIVIGNNFTMNLGTASPTFTAMNVLNSGLNTQTATVSLFLNAIYNQVDVTSSLNDLNGQVMQFNASGAGALSGSVRGFWADLDNAGLVSASSGTIYGFYAQVGGATNYSFFADSGTARFTDDLEVVGTTTLDTSLTGPLQATAGVVSAIPASSPYTQTYSTADRTLGAYAADVESSAYTGINNLQGGTPYAQVTDLNALRVAYENLRAFTEDAVQMLNAVVDDLQTAGLLG